MISQELIDESYRLIERIAPELHCYVVDDKLLEGLPISTGCRGQAIDPHWCIFEVRHRLTEANLWTGPKPIIALSTPELLDSSDYGPKFREQTLRTVIHETAHHLPATDVSIPDEALLELTDSVGVRELQINKVREATAIQKTVEIDSADNPHGFAFVRRCCHLVARARLAGWTIPSRDLLGGDCLHCGWVTHWVEIALPEIFELVSATFEEIEATQPLESLTTEWQQSVAWWQSLQRKGDDDAK